MSKSRQNQTDRKENPKNKSYPLISVSIIFAGAMIMSSLIVADSNTSQTINFLMIAGWFIPFFYFAKAKKQSSNS